MCYFIQILTANCIFNLKKTNLWPKKSYQNAGILRMSEAHPSSDISIYRRLSDLGHLSGIRRIPDIGYLIKDILWVPVGYPPSASDIRGSIGYPTDILCYVESSCLLGWKFENSLHGYQNFDYILVGPDGKWVDASVDSSSFLVLALLNKSKYFDNSFL